MSAPIRQFTMLGVQGVTCTGDECGPVLDAEPAAPGALQQAAGASAG